MNDATSVEVANDVLIVRYYYSLLVLVNYINYSYTVSSI